MNASDRTEVYVDDPRESRSVATAIVRGARHRCPNCGTGSLYRAYLKTVEACPGCGEAMHHHRADDAPPYVTIFVVGHLVVASVLAVDMVHEWPMWLIVAVWFPITIALCLAFLPVAKGALVGLQWALRMHGFGDGDDIAETHPSLE